MPEASVVSEVALLSDGYITAQTPPPILVIISENKALSEAKATAQGGSRRAGLRLGLSHGFDKCGLCARPRLVVGRELCACGLTARLSTGPCCLAWKPSPQVPVGYESGRKYKRSHAVIVTILFCLAVLISAISVIHFWWRRCREKHFR